MPHTTQCEMDAASAHSAENLALTKVCSSLDSTKEWWSRKHWHQHNPECCVALHLAYLGTIPMPAKHYAAADVGSSGIAEDVNISRSTGSPCNNLCENRKRKKNVTAADAKRPTQMLGPSLHKLGVSVCQSFMSKVAQTGVKVCKQILKFQVCTNWWCHEVCSESFTLPASEDAGVNIWNEK